MAREYGPAKTLYNRWKRWSRKDIFFRMMEGLATPQDTDCKTIMVDETYLKAHRTASSLLTKRRGTGENEPDGSQPSTISARRPSPPQSLSPKPSPSGLINQS